MTNKLNIQPDFSKLLLGSKSAKIIKSSSREEVSIRVSEKQLWFFAYMSKKVYGKNFEMKDARGNHFGYPISFAVGQWDDKSWHFAQATKNTINGPYNITFTLKFDNEK